MESLRLEEDGDGFGEAEAGDLAHPGARGGAQVGEGPMAQMADQFWGDRCGMFTDPAGYRWTIATRKEDLTPAEMQQRQDEFMKQFAQP